MIQKAIHRCGNNTARYAIRFVCVKRAKKAPDSVPAPDCMAYSFSAFGLFLILPDPVAECYLENSLEMIKEKIDHGCYCIVEVNVRYISNSACFKYQTDGTHGILIHGYDDDSRKVSVVSFGANGRPEHVNVSYDDLIKALNTSSPVNPCMFFKPKDIKYGFRWDKILSSLIFHLGKHEAVLDEEKGIKVSTGYAAEERLAECLPLNGDRGIDIRLFAMLKDHKKVLIQAVKSFSEFGIVFDDAVTSGLESILKNADIAEKLCIKYNMLRDRSIKKRIAERILQIISEEKKIYPMMIDSIGCYVFEYVVQRDCRAEYVLPETQISRPYIIDFVHALICM